MIGGTGAALEACGTLGIDAGLEVDEDEVEAPKEGRGDLEVPGLAD